MATQLIKPYCGLFTLALNIPLAIICSMVTVTVFYVLVNVAYYTMISPAELLLSDAVAVMFANRMLHGLTAVIPVLVALSCLGTLNSDFFAGSRMLFVGAREGHWPPIFSMIHIHRHTPLPAVLLLVKYIPHTLINVVSFGSWFFMALATLGMLIHRYHFPLHPRPFKVSLPVVIALNCKAFLIHLHTSLTKCYLLCLITQRCPWPSHSSSQWFASSLWVCLCIQTPGTQG
uniref:Uncharacterized protein n=1 Tax=Monopterus albus TaxID=43700 RepID=A0A3Q3QT27_MONAL